MPKIWRPLTARPCRATPLKDPKLKFREQDAKRRRLGSLKAEDSEEEEEEEDAHFKYQIGGTMVMIERFPTLPFPSIMYSLCSILRLLARFASQ